MTDFETGFAGNQNRVEADGWPPEPEMEIMREGIDLPLPVALAPVIALVVCAVLRQLLL